MTAQEIIEKIRAEIERLKQEIYPVKVGEQRVNRGPTSMESAALGALNAIMSRISTLQEQPVCEGLEEEIGKRWKEWLSEDKEQVDGVLPKSEFAFYARHFAQWGAEHAKIDEIPVSDDLDEAAKKHAHCPFTDDDGNFHEDAFDGTAYRDFIAGAKWQKEQDEKELSEKIGESYQIGLLDMKEQLMKDALDKIVHLEWGKKKIEIYDKELEGLKFGDKVKLIIIKED